MRLIAQAGSTLTDFTQQFGFTRTRMTHQGQGRYNRIADSIVDALDALYASNDQELAEGVWELYGHTDLQTEYQNWRKAKRAEARLPLKFERALVGERSIERLVRQVGGVSTLSRELCVNEFTLRRYWLGDTAFLPTDIVDALRDTGWRWTESFISKCDIEDRRRVPGAEPPDRKVRK